MISAQPLPQNAPAPLDAAWARVRLILEALSCFAASPNALARGAPLSTKARAAFLAIVRAGEIAARRLLLVMARALAAPATLKLARVRRASVRAGCGRAGFASEDSHDWPVRFALSLPSRPARTKHMRARSKGGAAPSNFALAERCEALARVLADPARYAARLARRLQAQPRIAARILAARPPERLIDFTEELIAPLRAMHPDTS